MDINVTGVWERNVTGQGVTVVVVDDGVEHTIKDIQPNYVSGFPPSAAVQVHGVAFSFLNQERKRAEEGQSGLGLGSLFGWLAQPTTVRNGWGEPRKLGSP